MEPDLTGLLNQAVTITTRTARDVYGAATWGTPATYPARVAPHVPLVQDVENDAAPITGMIHLDGDVVVTTEHQITLPDGSTPTIVRVDKFTDEDGSVYATRVMVG